MNRKFLENELSSVEDETLRKEIIDNIMKKNGEDIEKHKVEVATLKNEIKTKQGVIDNLNDKIKENDNVDIEAIKKEEFEKGKAEGSQEVETFKKNVALKEAIKGTKVKDVDLLMKLIADDKITYQEKDGNYEVGGLEEQVSEIKKTHDYLFEVEEPKEQPKQRISVGDGHSNNPPKAETTTLLGALHEKYSK